MEAPLINYPEILSRAARRIQPPTSAAPFRTRLESLTKPLGSLGTLEDLAVQLGQIGLLDRPHVRAVYVFAADHGVASEGVSAYPAEVTRQMVLNFMAGGAAVNVLGRLEHAAVHVVDAGIAGNLPEFPQLWAGKIAAGSRNITQEPAMNHSEFTAALSLGLICSDEAHANGYTLVAAGEMGIGNTTAAAAITAALTGAPLNQVTGKGTGLDEAARFRKIAVLERVLTLHAAKLDQPAEVLRRVGGLELAAIAGFVVGCASHGIAVVADGFIATAAIACALGVVPELRPYLFAGHQSEEPGHAVLLAHIQLKPILTLNMRLGEGTGAVLAMPVLEAARVLYGEMATFSSAGVSEAER